MFGFRYYSQIAFYLLLVNLPTSAFSEQENPYLTGDWGGQRAKLEEKGFNFETILTNELVSNLSGGLEKDARFHGDVDLTLTVDTEKAGIIPGGTFFAYFLGLYGESPSAAVGDVQVSSNIDAPQSISLYEFWYNQSLYQDTVSVLFGLHDYNSEFNTVEYGSTLVNSSFGITPEISQNGVSIFPQTSLGGVLRLKPSESHYWINSLYDGVPGKEGHTRGTHIEFDGGDGIFWGSELGYIAPEDADSYYKAALGYWLHTKDFEDVRGEAKDRNWGVYAILEHSLTTESDKEQGLGAFLQLGISDKDTGFVSKYVGSGLQYVGLFEGRDDDVTAIGIANAFISDDAKELDNSLKSVETAVEVTHKFQVTPYMTLQPDIQYIVNPGVVKGVDDALVLTVRSELSF